MSLIDAEDFSKVIKDYFHDMITHHKYNVDCVDCNADLQHLLYEQPTAYDIDKVVEGLEEVAYVSEDVNSFVDLEDAIEIVKQGSISDDVCEWHCDEYGRWHTECHYLADNDPLEYTFCPYCGKKIKVVE